MHVPKTAGTSMVLGLERALNPGVIQWGFDRSLFGLFDDFGSIDPALRAQIHGPADLLRPDAGLASGHMALSTLRSSYPHAQLVTLLREPVSRVLSHWLYWRRLTDAMVEPWGSWRHRVTRSRAPLAEFLDDPLLACQTDNLAARMLLWPGPLIPGDAFIDPAHDAALLGRALANLDGFSFATVTEDDAFADKFGRWLGAPFTQGRENETGDIPRMFRSPLHAELTDRAYGLLDARSRLDAVLWATLARRNIESRDIGRTRERILTRNVARYGALMAGGDGAG